MLLGNLASTRRWARAFALQLQRGDIVFLRGSLGAGKTTLAQAIARELGVNEPVTSPTYTLINEYQGRLTLVHMDLYRLGGVEEFELIGGWDALTADAVSLIEWPERLEGSHQLPTWEVELSFDGEERRLSCRGPLRRSS